MSDIEEILKKILEIADFPQDKREDFVNTFYKYLFMRSFDVIEEVDKEGADRLTNALLKAENDSEEINAIWKDILLNEEIVDKLREMTNGVLAEVAEDISDGSNEEEKQRILDYLNSIN